MAIRRSRIEEYGAGLNALVEQAQADIKAVYDAFYPLRDAELMRDAMIDAVQAASDKYGDMAATLGAELFEELGEEEAGGAFDALLSDTVDRAQLESSVRYSARHLFGGEWAVFLDYLNGALDKAVKQPARDTVMDNAARHAASGVRFARIPKGPTCPFCTMLASRGFVYRTEASAGELHKFHPSCDCQIVPSWEKSPRVEGYDPDGMYRRYRLCAETCGSDRAEDVLGEMATRDRRWLYDGTPVAVAKEKGAKPNSDEQAVANILSNLGFRTEFVAESKEKFVKSPDARLNGILWEFKIPTAFNEKTVKNQFKKSLGKGTRKLLISNYANRADATDVVKGVRRILDSGEFAEIDEVLFVGFDGTLVRLKR